MADQITFENVSRFYGEVLGVNRVSLSIPPGITSLGGSERVGQDDADEPDHGAGPADPR